MERVEASFIKHFANANRRHGMRDLRPRAKRDKHRVTFFVGKMLGTVRFYCILENLHYNFFSLEGSRAPLVSPPMPTRTLLRPVTALPNQQNLEVK